MMIIIITCTIVIIINDIWVALDRSATNVLSQRLNLGAYGNGDCCN